MPDLNHYILDNPLGTIIVDCAIQLHRPLGPGILNVGEELMKNRITQTINGDPDEQHCAVMIKKFKYASFSIMMMLIISGCITSKTKHLSDYTPPPTLCHTFDHNAVEEYFFLSWEPYHFICTLGLLPQYHYVIYENASGGYEKYSTMIGWCAIPLPLISSWKYGDIREKDKPTHKEQQNKPDAADDTFPFLRASIYNNLDMLVAANISPEKRGELYENLTNVDFELIAAKLATLLGTYSVVSNGEYVSGVGPLTKQPWTEERLNKRERIVFTLRQLWSHHIGDASSRNKRFGLMLALVEDATVDKGRFVALNVVKTCLHSGKYDAYSSLPPVTNVIDRLDKLAWDESLPADLRQNIIAVLFEHADPNRYIDLAMDFAESEPTENKRMQVFQYCTPPYQREKLTGNNRSRILRYAFSKLNNIDDGKTGKGYSLAPYIGYFAGVKPIREGQGEFAPDQRLPQYQGEHGLTRSFFQETVNNARAWWKTNQHLYIWQNVLQQVQ